MEKGTGCLATMDSLLVAARDVKISQQHDAHKLETSHDFCTMSNFFSIYHVLEEHRAFFTTNAAIDTAIISALVMKHGSASSMANDGNVCIIEECPGIVLTTRHSVMYCYSTSLIVSASDLNSDSRALSNNTISLRLFCSCNICGGGGPGGRGGRLTEQNGRRGRGIGVRMSNDPTVTEDIIARKYYLGHLIHHYHV